MRKIKKYIKKSYTFGRPTLYRAEMCEKVIELASYDKNKKPLNFMQIAAELDIVTETLYRWKREYKDFAAALNRARELHKNWFIEQVQNGFTDNKTTRLNTNAIRFYAYYNFGISENSANSRRKLNIDSRYYHKDTALKDKIQMLEEALINSHISSAIYDVMMKHLQSQLSRETEEKTDKDLNITFSVNSPKIEIKKDVKKEKVDAESD